MMAGEKGQTPFQGNTEEAFMRSLTNVTPSPATLDDILAVREDAKMLASVVFNRVPPSRERSLALTALEETVMWAVKALVLHQEEEG